jgi:prepilin-type N-terminal cleavage/methylation domain-containing protein/prepilin-type processing-associated H-X9-DG protein
MSKKMNNSVQPSKFSSTKRIQSGFTLIELLIVIAIIAILAAILFPVFGRARENARRSSCQSNLKQLGLGIMQYIQDYDETYSPGSGTGLWQNSWARRVEPYIKSVQVYRCPSDPVPPIQANVPSTNPGPRISYVANGVWGWSGVAGSTDNALFGMMGCETCAGTYAPGRFVRKLSSVTKASETILLTERAAVYANAATTDGPYYNWGYYVVLTGNANVFHSTGTSNCVQRIPNGAGTVTADPYDCSGSNGAVTPIHFERANFLFVDGHVKAMKPTDTNPNVGTTAVKNSNNMWRAERS